MARNVGPRLAVLGAGPIGIEAALYATTLGLPVTVYEAGQVGEHLRQWGHARLFSPFGMNVTPLGRARLDDLPDDNACITGREHLATYLQPLAASMKEYIRTRTRVMQIGKHGLLKAESSGGAERGKQSFRLLLRSEKGEESIEEADVVLDCTGTYGKPRWLGDGGIPALGEMAARPHIAYGLDDILGERRANYADKTTLVIGGGYSAATTACNLSVLADKHQGTWTIWLARTSRSQPIRRQMNDPLRERDQLAVRANTLATRADGGVEFHPGSFIESIEHRGPDEGFDIFAHCGGKEKTWEVDRVIANVGYTPDAELYRELQVHECYATLGPMALAAALQKHAGSDCLAIPAQGAAAMRNPEPNFFILGAKSYGRNSQFLLRNGFEQVREVFTLITGKADLDLYRKR
jgi:thioredoxin reductase